MSNEQDAEAISRTQAATLADYEECFLGCLLKPGEKQPRLMMQPHYFHGTNNGKIFKVYLEQLKRGVKPDIGTLSNDPDLRDIGAAYIFPLSNKVSSSVNIAFYENEIIKAWQVRTAKAAGEKFKAKIETAALTGEIKPAIREYIGVLSGALAEEPPAGGGFQFVRVDSLEVRPPSWLVKGLIETDAFGCLYGDPGTGKSFIGIELSACVATGTQFYGLPVKKGPVIYLAGEGQSGLARRLKAWSVIRGVSLDGAAFYTNSKPLSLIDNNSMVCVVQALERLVTEIGHPPAMAILDTWSRVLGGDDSSPSDAAAGVAALDDLRARFGNFAALVIHHEGHTKGRGRGWSGLRAAVDVELRAELGNDKVLRLECTKSKDTESIKPMAFRFARVELDIRTESGDMVTSAVLEPTGWTPAPEGINKKPVGKNQTLIMDILRRMETDAKKNQEGDNTVSLELWRKECMANGLTRNQFWYAKEGLEKNGNIQITDGIVCCVGVGLGVGFRGLLYSPPNPPNASNACTPVGNIENPTLSNASNAQELFQNEKTEAAN